MVKIILYYGHGFLANFFHQKADNDMDVQTARLLCKITKDFYRRHGASFSATRQSAWPGWTRCLDIWREVGLLSGERAQDAESAEALRVFDLACGNLRFETFMAEAPEVKRVTFYAVDNCDDLARSGTLWADALRRTVSDDSQFVVPGGVRHDEEGALRSDLHCNLCYQNLDVMEVLFDGVPLSDLLEAPPCDLSVSFGFMHHIPLEAQRVAVLQALVDQTRAGGCVAVSFWRFLHDPAYAAKAHAEHKRAATALGLPQLPESDCVLGWKGLPEAYRYCHSFTAEEIDSLLTSVAHQARPIARFTSDARTGAMNEYVIFSVD